MILRTVRPYPGELLSSTLIRACRRYRISPWTLGEKVLQAPGWRLSFMGTVPSELMALLTGITMEDALRHHTPLPYAGAFSPPETWWKCWSDGVSGTESAPLRGMMQNALAHPTTRRHCADCTQSDLAAYGESFWRTSHQLPGVMHCAFHQAPLSFTGIPFRARGAEALALPSECAGKATSVRRAAFLILAARTKALQEGPRPEARSSAYYRALAVSAGLLGTHRQVRSDVVSQLLCRCFSRDALRKLGLLDTEDEPSWGSLLFRPRGSSGYAPLKHLLLEQTLTTEQIGSQGCLDHRSSGPPGTGDDVLDQHYSAAAQRVLKSAVATKSVLTTEQFLRAAGCYGTYRHRLDKMPKLRSVVLAFRSSPASIKQLGPGKMLFRSHPEERVPGSSKR